MEDLLERKEPDKNHLKLFDEMAVKMKEVIKDSDIPQPTNNGESSAYLNLFKYWNDFLIKGKLPSYNWIVGNVFRASDLGGASIFMGCKELAIFQFYSTEFIDFLAKSIKSIGSKKIIEIGAGDGLLSHFLQQKGIDIIPTDDHSRDDITHPMRVEKLSHKEALEKHNPEVVLISWEELDYTYSIDVLNYHSVKCIVIIGEYDGGCTGSKKLWNYENQDTDNPYCLARTDNCMFGENVHKHTGVWIFYPKKST